MNNTQKKYMSIPWTINILGERTIRVLRRGEKKFNTKKFMQIIWLCVLVVIGLLFLNQKTEASNPKYKTNICETNKCKARVERLNKCNGDIDCAVNLTLEASYPNLYTEISSLEEKSSKEVKSGLNSAIGFITKFEWLRLEAYFDWYANNSNRWSIWYGTKSYKWEVITKEEAIKRKMAVIEPLYNGIPACFNQNQKIALSSYMYNT